MADANAFGAAIVVPSYGVPDTTVAQAALVVVLGETPPQAGGATVSAFAAVAVQIEFKQPYRNLQLPLIAGPWAFPLWIAKGI